VTVTPLRAPSWELDGQDWPNRDCSRFMTAAGLRWHVQCAGTGPVCLLLHGTGASTHSFRDLLPQLAQTFTVVAPDLPGHGFTERPRDLAGLSLPFSSSDYFHVLIVQFLNNVFQRRATLGFLDAFHLFCPFSCPSTLALPLPCHFSARFLSPLHILF